MTVDRVALVAEPDRVRLALSPIRRKLLERLQTPRSATELAAELALGRQRINYHLRALEAAGLIHLVEERQRRGCIERVLAARAEAFVVDPSVMGARAASAVRAAAQDRFAAEHLIDSGAAIVRDVARMQAQAARQGTRLLVFTVDTEVNFATPADLERFTTAVADFVAREAARHEATTGGRRYRVMFGGYPAPRIPRSGEQDETVGLRRRRDSRRSTH